MRIAAARRLGYPRLSGIRALSGAHARSGRTDGGSGILPNDPPAAARPSQPQAFEGLVLAFVDVIVIPFLTSLYGAVGYLGVFFAMVIESTLLPLPSELILPYAGFLISDHSQIEPLTHSPWNFWIVVVIGVLGATVSLISKCAYPSSRHQLGNNSANCFVAG